MLDVTKMDREELKAAREAKAAELRELEKAEAEYDGRRLAELKEEFRERLKSEGFTWSEVFEPGKRKASSSRTRGPAKYRHPENPETTWTGKGRQPAWFKEAIESGKAPEDMAV